jgi:hypothetical protein
MSETAQNGNISAGYNSLVNFVQHIKSEEYMMYYQNIQQTTTQHNNHLQYAIQICIQGRHSRLGHRH